MSFSSKKQKTVVIGVTGGIAAYKVLALISLLKKDNINPIIIMTHSASKLINPLEFEKVSGNKVFVSLFEKNFDYKRVLNNRKVDHIQIADAANLIIIVPATANIIAKVAHGIADDFLTTTLLASKAPVLFCPSMNTHMWTNPLTQQNIKTLQSLGYRFIEPGSGMLACGYEGKGRLPDPIVIRKEVLKLLGFSSVLKGKKIIVTSGGTIERIDAVRFIANRSSGKMGVAIAEACFSRGANVLLLRSRSSAQPNYSLAQETFETADELLQLIKKYVVVHDVFFHVAAVSDFTIRDPFREKLSGDKRVTLHLQPRSKLIQAVKKLNPRIVLVGFKAEYGLTDKELINECRKKLKECNADAMVGNDVKEKDRGFESDTNEVCILTSKGKVIKIPLATKKEVAYHILDTLIEEHCL